jgi:5-methylcytosine-specific restriction endonuclease McrBC GTP-binding regulatory subunit McrB
MAARNIGKKDSNTYPDEETEFVEENEVVDDLWQAENVDIEIENEENNEKFDKNIILYGPPGTGKTYNTAIYAVAICDGVSLEKIRLKPYKEVMNRYRQLSNAEKRITFTTFHQSYGYEDFIEGIRPRLDGGNEIEYVINDGVFKSFCNHSGQTEKPCVFIIDEINRGNISKIFGELITLIEDTKREGMEEGVFATLPYSGDKFSVPKNVYIIGTMNTADRSIALMDTALRRRFKFEEMLPDTQVLRNLQADKVVDGEMELDVVEMLETINRRITYLYDREHTIGHAFFTGLKNEPTVSRLSEIFKKSVIPLLQEYFYGDYSKIMLVLGDNGKSVDEHKFILAKEINAGAVFKGDCSDLDIPDYSYEIQETAFDNILSYIEIMN